MTTATSNERKVFFHGQAYVAENCGTKKLRIRWPAGEINQSAEMVNDVDWSGVDGIAPVEELIARTRESNQDIMQEVTNCTFAGVATLAPDGTVKAISEIMPRAICQPDFGQILSNNAHGISIQLLNTKPEEAESLDYKLVACADLMIGLPDKQWVSYHVVRHPETRQVVGILDAIEEGRVPRQGPLTVEERKRLMERHTTLQALPAGLRRPLTDSGGDRGTSPTGPQR